jgi:RimJ/RimL family protein N-acetyltransferase
MILEPFAPAHSTEVFRLWSDFEAIKFTNWSHTPTLDECHQRTTKVISFYAKQPLHFGPYAIRLADARFVGIIGADLVDRNRGEYDIWYALCRDEWHKGIAQKAVGRLLQEMRVSKRVQRATASVVIENPRSSRLLERHGFVLEKALPAGFQKHGMTLDLNTYCLELAVTS